MERRLSPRQGWASEDDTVATAVAQATSAYPNCLWKADRSYHAKESKNLRRYYQLVASNAVVKADNFVGQLIAGALRQ